jgi:hypothetical protein
MRSSILVLPKLTFQPDTEPQLYSLDPEDKVRIDDAVAQLKSNDGDGE